MDIHEYQAKEILSAYDLPILPGRLVEKLEDVRGAYLKLETPVVVVKAQVHAGGRGAGRFQGEDKGGVRVVQSLQEAEVAAEAMLGHVLITKQTGPEGRRVGKLYLEAGCRIEKEFYLSIVLDRRTSRPSLVLSGEGGMDIEDVAAKSPEKILTMDVDPVVGIMPFHARRAQEFLGLDSAGGMELARCLRGLYRAYGNNDMALLEINPLVQDAEGHLVLLDAKVTLEDNGLARHPELVKLRDLAEEDPTETKAREIGLSYIKLDGTIGCMVNGAGLAMATMDLIKLKGGEPANFLDVGGSATEEMVADALEIILEDSRVRGVFVNIFGGIMRGDVIARGLVTGAKRKRIALPVVVRLQGTNLEQGRKILEKSALPLHFEDNLDKAAGRIVELVGV